MIESQSSSKQADANNNDDECKPLSLLAETDKCLELNSTLQASTSDARHQRHTETRSNPVSSARSAAPSQTAGSSTGSNAANSTLAAAAATTAGHYIPQQPKSERKAAKTLSAILLAFIITWTPYNVVALLRSTLDEDNQDYIPKPVSNAKYTGGLTGCTKWVLLKL